MLHLRRHVEELEPHVASGQGIVVVLRQAAGRPAVNGAERREIRTVDRVEEVGRAQLEHPRRRRRIEVDERRIVETVLDEVGEIVHLIVGSGPGREASQVRGDG